MIAGAVVIAVVAIVIELVLQLVGRLVTPGPDRLRLRRASSGARRPRPPGHRSPARQPARESPTQ